MNYQVK